MPAVVFVETGEAFVADKVSPQATATAFHIGWGTGGSSTGATATNADIDLAAAATELRVTATVEDQSAADTCRWIGILTAVGTAKTIEEAGLFFHGTSTATALIIRTSHGGVALATDDQIQYTFTLQFSGTCT